MEEKPVGDKSPNPDQVKKLRPPILFRGQVVVEIEASPPPSEYGGSPFDPYTFRVCPFSADESDEYTEALSAPGKDRKAVKAVRVKWLTPRLKGWNVTLGDGPDGEPIPAPINEGTVAALPPWAFVVIEAALYGEAGRVVGN